MQRGIGLVPSRGVFVPDCVYRDILPFTRRDPGGIRRWQQLRSHRLRRRTARNSSPSIPASRLRSSRTSRATVEGGHRIRHVGRAHAHKRRLRWSERDALGGEDELLVQAQSVTRCAAVGPEEWVRNPPLFVRALSGADRRELQAGLRSLAAFRFRRVLNLLASDEGQRSAPR